MWVEEEGRSHSPLKSHCCRPSRLSVDSHPSDAAIDPISTAVSTVQHREADQWLRLAIRQHHSLSDTNCARLVIFTFHPPL